MYPERLLRIIIFVCLSSQLLWCHTLNVSNKFQQSLVKSEITCLWFWVAVIKIITELHTRRDLSVNVSLLCVYVCVSFVSRTEMADGATKKKNDKKQWRKNGQRWKKWDERKKNNKMGRTNSLKTVAYFEGNDCDLEKTRDIRENMGWEHHNNPWG